MPPRLSARKIALAACFAVAGLVLPVTASAATAPKPAIGEAFPDPDVLSYGISYYAYSTNVGYSDGVRNVPVRQTSVTMDGQWTDRGDALPNLPGWVGRYRGTGSYNVWAPDVSRRADGTFVMYFAANNKADNHQCIGAATSWTPLGPFKPVQNPIVCTKSAFEEIDPATFDEFLGKHYLSYKSAPNPGGIGAKIYVAEVSADGLHVTGPARAVLAADRPEERGVIEAPTLIKRGFTYYLFYSAAPFNSGHYFVNYATAKSPYGPFTKAPGTLLDGNTYGMRLPDPGGQDIVSTVFGDRIVFHADTAKGRQMFVRPLNWNLLNGRPSIG
ncbi:glycoside hydrolase family 43 protein [Sciscionella sediminilitoris]|uniref:glycoside hydrolase family 43 protein n=1 Tax=Sciscionella sediminilitoris TaxID=1445613 RepID=UPI00068A0E6A|nr:glycoside hydrolase family 43 protein [Sciscionella sp. SE31]